MAEHPKLGTSLGEYAADGLGGKITWMQWRQIERDLRKADRTLTPQEEEGMRRVREGTA